jgi:DNA polymerase alpha subunit B N-terminal
MLGCISDTTNNEKVEGQHRHDDDAAALRYSLPCRLTSHQRSERLSRKLVYRRSTLRSWGSVSALLLPCAFSTNATLALRLNFSVNPGAALVKTFHVKPNELAECWEAYSLTKNIEKLDKASYENFRKHIIKERNIDDDGAMDIDGAVFTRPKRRSESNAAVISPFSNKRQYLSVHIQQQSDSGRTLLDKGRVSLSPESPRLEQETTKKPAFSERKDSGKVIAAFNPKNLPVPSARPAGTTRRCTVDFERYDTNVNRPYRHMFTTLEERSRQLDVMIQEKQELYSERYDFGSETFAELEAVGIPRQETVCCVGRICNAVRTA